MTAKKPKIRRHYGQSRSIPTSSRIKVMQVVLFAVAGILIARLAFLQIVQHSIYEALASGQRELYKELFPERGDVLVVDKDGEEVAIATNRYLSLVWAEPRRVDDPVRTAQVLGEILGYNKVASGSSSNAREVVAAGEDGSYLTDGTYEQEGAEEEPSKNDVLLGKLSKINDPYEPIEHKVTDEVAEEIRRANLPGIHLLQERFRYYPEGSMTSHVTGFVSGDDDGGFSGKYGIEGYLDETLAGHRGYLFSELDAKGRWISVGSRNREPAQDGADVLLTIDRTVQFVACETLKDAVEEYEADKGSVVILDPKTGAVRAMCGFPDYDPNIFNEVEDISVYNNQITFEAYEPGSVFKPLVMAAGIDSGAVTPQTSYYDTGEEKIEEYTIRNSDLKAYEWQTMTQVLEKSLNTGMIFAMREMGMEQMASYVHGFGFGNQTKIRLNSEVRGDIQNVDKGYEIFSATSSYGQGITTTPLQMAMAYTALANEGSVMIPHVVKEIRYDDGTVEVVAPEVLKQVLSPRSAQLVSAMLISVIENGHAGEAGVEGYYIAGKTGTAQVAKENGSGYQKDNTIATFVGYGPARDPSFVILVRIDHPRTTQWAAGTAAPTFGKIAEFLLQYDNIAPER
ncbi:penicillin-binding protein 2 [Candidatus Uhrbacteria bacterium]|nr:penicillin-binding protein 2 [Candidatus Uhrbacteria bacterium]